MRLLILCATERSRDARKAETILARFGLRATEIYAIGPDLRIGPRQCAGDMDMCLATLGRKRFDIILNEYCPTNEPPDYLVLSQLLMLVERVAKRHAIYITPLIPKLGRKRGEVLNWDDYVSPSWLELLAALGFEERAYLHREWLVALER